MEATIVKIVYTASQLPLLAVPATEYLTHEIASITVSYGEGIASEDPIDAQRQIEAPIAHIDAVYNDLGNRMRDNNTSSSRAFT